MSVEMVEKSIIWSFISYLSTDSTQLYNHLWFLVSKALPSFSKRMYRSWDSSYANILSNMWLSSICRVFTNMWILEHKIADVELKLFSWCLKWYMEVGTTNPCLRYELMSSSDPHDPWDTLRWIIRHYFLGAVEMYNFFWKVHK